MYIKHYKKAQAIKRGFVPFDYKEYKGHIECAYALVIEQGLLDSSDQTVKNIIRLYKEL